MLLFIITADLNEDDKKVISEIYYEYRHLMKMVAMRYFRDESTADDIVQDAFFRIRRNLGKISSLTCNRKRAYIVNIVKNLSVDYLRKMDREKKRSSSLEVMNIDIKSDEISIEEFVMREEFRLAFSRMMLELSDKDADILKAKYYYGYSTKEICERFDIASENTARSRLKRARGRFLNIVKESGINYEK